MISLWGVYSFVAVVKQGGFHTIAEPSPVSPRYRGLTVLGYAALIGCASTLHAQQPPARLATFLQQSIGLEATQIASIELGKPVVKVLETQNKRDVAVFGIIRVDVSREFYVTRLQDFPTSLRTPTRVRFGIFQVPANPADVEGTTVTKDDVAEIQKCSPGKCKIKMPATDMQRLHSQIDWSGADPGAQVNAYLRRRLLEYATDYRARGDSAMVVYDDHGGVHASDAFAALLAQSPYVYQDMPSLRQYLAGYPHAKLDGAREVLFWAVDSAAGLKPVLSVTHMVVHAPPEFQSMTVLAAKQIYANHYFEGTFDLTAVIDRAGEAGKPSLYLIQLRRVRFDNLPTGPVISIRGKVVAKLRDQMGIDLQRQKQVSEQAQGAKGNDR
jgi:hypothetical protein